VRTAALINEELATFLESGLPTGVATRDAALDPDGAMVWGLRVHPDGIGLTLFMHERAAAAMLRNLEAHPEIAIVTDRPSDHRACQLKGRFESARPARDDEREYVERQIDGVRGALEVIGIPRAMTVGWAWWPCAALEIRVTQLFEQTPGPRAGEPLP
jgi:hypothetical protein